jgi:hypothetical protein
MKIEDIKNVKDCERAVYEIAIELNKLPIPKENAKLPIGEQVENGLKLAELNLRLLMVNEKLRLF